MVLDAVDDPAGRTDSDKRAVNTKISKEKNESKGE